MVNRPVTNFMRHHTAETIFDRLERCGRTWKVYVLEPGPLSFTGFIHMPRLRDRFATHFVPFAEFERDAAEGTLPDFSLIEPNLMAGHGDYHPAFGRALIPGLEVLMDAPSSILAGEDFLGRIYRAVRSASSPTGSHAFNTMLFVGFDEPGGTYDHVPPGPVPPPHPGAPPGQLGFAFDRSGYRVPAVLVSPWVPEGTVCTEEYRHTSLLATLRSVWDLGEPFTARDAAARTFEGVCSLEVPRPPEAWPEVHPLPVPAFQAERVDAMRALGTLGRHLCHGLYEHAAPRPGPPRPARCRPHRLPHARHRLRDAPRRPAVPTVGQGTTGALSARRCDRGDLMAPWVATHHVAEVAPNPSCAHSNREPFDHSGFHSVTHISSPVICSTRWTIGVGRETTRLPPSLIAICRAAWIAPSPEESMKVRWWRSTTSSEPGGPTTRSVKPRQLSASSSPRNVKTRPPSKS